MPNLTISRPVRIVAYFVAVVIALIAALGITVTFAYNGAYYPGTTVGGVAIGGMQRTAAEALVRARVDATAARSLTLAVPDPTAARDASGKLPEKTVSVKASDLGYTTDVDTALAEAWKTGHARSGFAWIRDAIRTAVLGKSIAIHQELDATKVQTFVATDVRNIADTPEPAKVSVNGPTVELVSAKPGLLLDTDATTTTISSAVLSTFDTEPLSLRLKPDIAQSNVTDDTLAPLVAELNALGDVKVTLQGTGVSIRPSRADILQWFIIVQADNGALSLAVGSDRVTTYLKGAGKQFDQTKALPVLTSALQDWLKVLPKTVTITLPTVAKVQVATPGTFKLGLFDGKYVYVNLSEQKLYRINGNTLEKVYIVSSGKWSTPTPRGSYTIRSKTPRAYSAEFGLYMPWWENFVGTSAAGDALPIGAYGLHELPEWPNGYKEGEGHLGTAVSHGCVRLGVGDAEELYNWTEVGTPVVIE